MALTSPTRRASQFFKFLSEVEHDCPVPDLPRAPGTDSREPSAPSPPSPSTSKPVPPSPRGPRSLHPRPSLTSSTAPPTADHQPNLRTNTATLIVRDGPKQSQTHVSPAPRRHPPPLPPVPAQYQSQTTKPLRAKPAVLGHRVPFDELRNADADAPSARKVSVTATARSVSVASSVYPQIETQDPALDPDPYTPLPPRRPRERHAAGENVPPNAPARPVRGQTRKPVRDGTRSRRRKENNAAQLVPSPQTAPNEKIILDSSLRSTEGAQTLRMSFFDVKSLIA
jgi:hypothetical protein